MIFRLLLLFLIIWFLIWIIRKQLSSNQPNDRQDRIDQAEDMQPCAYCGTHVPRSLAIESNNKLYCCQEHAQLDAESK